MAQNGEAAQRNLHKIFYPESVAVVGTNRVAGTVPHDIFANILRDHYQGIVYPVSPGERSVAGVKAYKYIVDIDDPVDLAIIVFPSSVCHLAMEQLAEKGVTAAIVISAGFREMGGIGVEREQQIRQIAREAEINFIGPNCLGVINTDPATHLNASFARQMPEEGNIAFLSQSGALCTAVLDYARAKHIGFSKFISFGNKADITEIDLLHYLKDDPRTRVILLYLEEISDGLGLMRAAEEIITETGKPILAMKSGRTSIGAAAAASHTGSLAGDDEAVNAAFRQAGIIRCENIEEMFNKAIAFAYQPLPERNRVAIITNAGGPGVLAADAAAREGLTLAEFSKPTTQAFKKSLPKTANIQNPVDVIGDAKADRYKVAVTNALQDTHVDGVMVILTPQSMTDIDRIAEEICSAAGKYEKPVYASFMGQADVASGIEILQRKNIPHYILPESMLSSLASTYAFTLHRQRPAEDIPAFPEIDKNAAREIVEQAKEAGQPALQEMEAVKVLQAYGLPVPAAGVASSEDEAIEVAGRVGFPVALKVIASQITHKIDVGGVRLDLSTPEEVRAASQAILKNVADSQPDAEIEGVYIQEMVPAGVEVILGIKRDPVFGPIVMFGLGGTFVELFRDVSFRIPPFGPRIAGEMIQEIKSYEMLTGYRGKPAADIEAIEDALQRLARLAVDCPQITELDINPLIVQPGDQGCAVADVRIML